ncbi:MAG: spore maturation protein [candidate division KSB1 bacterium]|nr:spore maturation protein [candidate division KSB1 bacterium]
MVEFGKIMGFISDWAIPFLIFIIPVIGFARKVKVYEVFVEGAKEGFNVAVKIIPFLVAILVAIGMFRASGAMDWFTKLISPLTNLIGMPAETVPVALMRPLSGSGALGIASELISTHGASSMIGRIASVMYGSTDTTFYIIALYFGSVGIKKTRHAVPAGLIADAAGLLAAVFFCRLIFG